MGTRKNWTNDEDLVLLRQVNADLPFAAKKGSVMDAWAQLAIIINGLGGFTRVVDGKKAQNRFITLLKEHDEADKASARASGVSETYDEKRELLDHLAPLVEEHKKKESARSEEEKRKKEEDIAAGARARDAAMEALGKRKKGPNEESPPKKNKLATTLAALAQETGRDTDVKEQELELRRLELEERRLELEERRREREENRREREEDRKERLRLAEMDREKTVAIITALMQRKDN